MQTGSSDSNSAYISKIANTHIFSKSVFDEYCKLNQYNQKRSEILKNSLKQEGFFISDRELTFIEPDKLKQLNEKYTLEDARRIADKKLVAKPMIVITGYMVTAPENFGA